MAITLVHERNSRRLRTQLAAQIIKLQRATELRAIILRGQHIDNLLAGAREAAVFGQKRMGRRTQHAVLVKQRIAVQAIGKMVAQLFYLFENAAVLPLLLGGFRHLRAVLIYVHVLVGLAEQIAHRAGIEIGGQRPACCIADGHCGVGLRILVRIRSNASQACLNGASVGPAQHGNELIAAIAPHKARVACYFRQLLRKRADVLVALLVP